MASTAAGAAGAVLYVGEYGGASPNFTGPSVVDQAFAVSILQTQVADPGIFVLSTIWAWECPSHQETMVCIVPNASPTSKEAGSSRMVRKDAIILSIQTRPEYRA